MTPPDLSGTGPRRVTSIALLVLGLAVVAAIWGTWLRILESLSTGRADVERSGQLIVQALDYELDVFIASLHGMKYLSEQLLADRVRALENPIGHLRPVPEHAGYQSQMPEHVSAPHTIGRITGEGALPAASHAVVREMAMAMALTPLMRAIKERGPDIPWVHYASASGFMFIFPYQGSESFFFTRELLQRDYLAQATPKTNPARRIFWSQPYLDAAGQGMLVTVSQPIDHKDRFLGSISIEFKIASLARYLQGSSMVRTHVRLLTRQGTHLAEAGHPAAEPGARHEVITIPLKNAPWLLELELDEHELLVSALRGRMWHITAVLVLLVTFIFVVLLSRSYRLARDLAITDGLTGLYNRRHFETLASHAFELARRGQCTIGMAMLDIDFFKKYNDHYGHQQGDRALQAVASALRQSLRRASDQVFRIGGEEFAILATLGQPEDMAVRAEKIKQAVRQLQLPHAQHPLGQVTVSIGATVIDRVHWLSVDATYRCVDQLLYEAKTTGRDRAVVRTSDRPNPS